MPEEKTTEKKLEREYIIPLRKEWLKVQAYRRAARAAKTIKKFIARHMKVSERDIKKVKLDVYLNNELFSYGIKHPPSKIKVRAIKENDIIKVELAEIPEIIKFRKARHLRIHTKEEKKEKIEEKKPTEEKKEESSEKTEEKKKEEQEKEKVLEQKQTKETKIKGKTEKHITKTKETQIFRRSMNRH